MLFWPIIVRREECWKNKAQRSEKEDIWHLNLLFLGAVVAVTRSREGWKCSLKIEEPQGPVLPFLGQGCWVLCSFLRASTHFACCSSIVFISFNLNLPELKLNFKHCCWIIMPLLFPFFFPPGFCVFIVGFFWSQARVQGEWWCQHQGLCKWVKLQLLFLPKRSLDTSK